MVRRVGKKGGVDRDIRTFVFRREPLSTLKSTIGRIVLWLVSNFIDKEQLFGGNGFLKPEGFEDNFIGWGSYVQILCYFGMLSLLPYMQTKSPSSLFLFAVLILGVGSKTPKALPICNSGVSSGAIVKGD